MSDVSFKNRATGSSIQPQPYDGYYKYDRSVARDYEKYREVESHWQREDEFVKSYLARRDVENLLDLGRESVAGGLRLRDNHSVVNHLYVVQRVL